MDWDDSIRALCPWQLQADVLDAAKHSVSTLTR
jgi:hypothetical protein